MVTVGIRELGQQASEFVCLVRETGSEVQVTQHGMDPSGFSLRNSPALPG